MDKFVCVRLVQAWGMDLSRFQFDRDQTWAAFFLNADGTIYGRYGTRTGREASHDVSIPGLEKALEATLALHAAYPANRTALAGKMGPRSPWKTAETIPRLRGRFAAVTTEKKRCLHCHFIPSAEVLTLRDERKSVDDRLLWSYPPPDVLGFTLDPKEIAKVSRVADGSVAATAGLRPGDEITSLEGQPIVSIADVQWVLHRADDDARLDARVVRKGQEIHLVLATDTGWRRRVDMSWRSQSWVIGDELLGLHLELLPTEAKSEHGIDANAPAWRIKRFTPKWYKGGNHIARKVGLEKGDVIVAIDGKSLPATKSDLLGYLVQKTQPKDVLALDVRRGRRELKVQLPVR